MTPELGGSPLGGGMENGLMRQPAMPPLEGQKDREAQNLASFESQGLLKGGKPRLGAARAYFLDLRDLDFSGLVDYYKAWRALPEFLLLHRPDDGVEGRKTIAVKCSKRGNDVYWWRTGKRLKRLRDLQDMEFFNWRSRGIKTTQAVFVTLTYDPKMGTVQGAWENEGILWNRWITNLRKKYGRIRYLRTWESFANGYPHVHAMLVFQDHEFRVMRMNGKNRVTEKAVFESSWSAHVDVQACSSLRNANLYITKYLTKEFHESSEEALDRSLRGLTLAMNWIFRKRSFAGSRDLAESIGDLHNSNSNSCQVTLDGGRIRDRWILVDPDRPTRTVGEMEGAYPGLDFRNRWHFELPFCAW